MADQFDKATRSRIMSKIKSKDTSIELELRKSLWSAGLRYRLHYAKLPGKPDVVFPKEKVAVFVDGDFWHGYNWKVLGKVPPKKYWQDKIEATRSRDKKYTQQLKKAGWKVLRFWEHDVEANLDGCVSKVKALLNIRT